MRPGPASYGSRIRGSESGRKTIGSVSGPAPASQREPIGPGPARCKLAGPLPGDDGGHEPTDRAEMQDAQVRKGTAGRSAARGGIATSNPISAAGLRQNRTGRERARPIGCF